MNSEKLLQLANAGGKFQIGNYLVEITKYKYRVKNITTDEILLDVQKNCVMFYLLEEILLGKD